MGGNISGPSQTQNYETESYRKLGKLDLNGDSKVSGTEIQFLDKLGKLGPNPTQDQVKNLFEKVPQTELKSSFIVFMKDQLSKMGEHPTEAQFQKLVDLMPDDKLKTTVGQFISQAVFGPGDVSFDPSQKKITVN